VRGQDAKSLIEAIKNSSYNLNDWEMDFMISVEEKADDGYSLTKKQADTLQKLYRKSQGGGCYIGKERIRRG
jgi:hypothetical protein